MAAAKAEVKLQDFTNIFSLEGKVAVVTGGSRGLVCPIPKSLLTLQTYQKPFEFTN